MPYSVLTPHRELQDPVAYPSPSVAEWSYLLTSLRKDVECTFGILKIRFRILKVPQVWLYRETLDSVFYTCCWLHNELHEDNGYGTRWDNILLICYFVNVSAQIHTANKWVYITNPPFFMLHE